MCCKTFREGHMTYNSRDQKKASRRGHLAGLGRRKRFVHIEIEKKASVQAGSTVRCKIIEPLRVSDIAKRKHKQKISESRQGESW